MKKRFVCLAVLLLTLTACTENGDSTYAQVPPSPQGGIGVRTERPAPTVSPIVREGGQVRRAE